MTTRLAALLLALAAPLPALAQLPPAQRCDDAVSVMPWRMAADGRQGWMIIANADALPHNPQTGLWAFILAMDPLPGFTLAGTVGANSGQPFATRARGAGPVMIPFGAGNMGADALKAAMRVTCRPVPAGG